MTVVLCFLCFLVGVALGFRLCEWSVQPLLDELDRTLREKVAHQFGGSR